MNTAVLIQQCSSLDSCSGEFHEMMRLTHQRHAAYARAHQMDFWSIYGDMADGKDWRTGAWAKIHLVLKALRQGYEWAFWIDADAAIVSQIDLRTALLEGKLIGGVEHWADWFPKYEIPKHVNVGVLYFRNAPKTRGFLMEWLGYYPGEPRWAEQGTFNKLILMDMYKDYFELLPDRWNATVNVHQCADPIVKGWHGVAPLALRLAQMKQVFIDDFLKFKVV
jgi:hypothetical protein